MMKRLFRKMNENKGEVMLESILVLIPTLFVMIFLLSLGFLLYQKWNVQFVADDIASKVAVSFEYIEEETPEAVVELEQAQKVYLYKYLFNMSDYENVNKQKATKYGSQLFRITGYGDGVGDEVIELELIEDSLARRHISVTVTGTYRIPFSEGLEIFGMEGTRTFTAVSYAECADISDYKNTVMFGQQVGSILLGDSEAIKAINSWIGVFKNIFD